jgi:hypothetical protein
MLRPIRPKPLIAILIAMNTSALRFLCARKSCGTSFDFKFRCWHFAQKARGVSAPRRRHIDARPAHFARGSAPIRQTSAYEQQSPKEKTAGGRRMQAVVN